MRDAPASLKSNDELSSQLLLAATGSSPPDDVSAEKLVSDRRGVVVAVWVVGSMRDSTDIDHCPMIGVAQERREMTTTRSDSHVSDGDRSADAGNGESSGLSSPEGGQKVASSRSLLSAAAIGDLQVPGASRFPR